MLACLSACASAAEQAARARDEAQVATSAGDMIGARSAMLRAVQAKDDDASLWIMLGRTQLALGDIGGAYQSYSRAVELDRTDAEALQAIADLSLVAGRLDDAERYAAQLELLQPGSPGLIATRGFLQLARKKPEEAIASANAVLAKRPYDPAGTILKARALSSSGAYAEAAELLEAQLKQRGMNSAVLTTLLGVYQGAENGSGLLRTRQRLFALEPDNGDRAFDYAEQLYRSGNAIAARDVALRVIRADSSPERIDRLLALWSDFERREQAVEIAHTLAQSAALADRVKYASFLIDKGAPELAEPLLQSQAGAPVSADAANAIAVFARARGARGDKVAATRRLDDVLRFDPGNDLALRARVDLDLAEQCPDKTLASVRRLTIQNPASPEDRLRLGKCYVLRGNRNLAEATYWAAFNEIPGNATLYRSLRVFFEQSGDRSDVALLTKRYQEQQRAINAAALAKA